MFRRVLLANLIVLLILASVLPVLAAAPAEGIVVEGESVPGVSLGDSREQVDAAYGLPDYCQGPERSYCTYPVEGGGQVNAFYQGLNGGPATGVPGDIVHAISWNNTAWTTTTGVNTALALADPNAVITAYPEAQVTTNQWGAIIRVEDTRQGITVEWSHDFYGGFTIVSMKIYTPREPAPLPEEITQVIEIDLRATKHRGQREIRALVLVRNEQQLGAEGAAVSATWSFPDGSSQIVEDITSSSGYAYFELLDLPRGTYTLTINDVVLDGYRFDQENSVLNTSITIK